MTNQLNGSKTVLVPTCKEHQDNISHHTRVFTDNGPLNPCCVDGCTQNADGKTRVEVDGIGIKNGRVFYLAIIQGWQ